MAARLANELQLDSTIVEGRRGEFSVWVDDAKVAEKTWSGFPTDDDIVARVGKAVASG